MELRDERYLEFACVRRITEGLGPGRRSSGAKILSLGAYLDRVDMNQAKKLLEGYVVKCAEVSEKDGPPFTLSEAVSWLNSFYHRPALSVRFQNQMDTLPGSIKQRFTAGERVISMAELQEIAYRTEAPVEIDAWARPQWPFGETRRLGFCRPPACHGCDRERATRIRERPVAEHIPQAAFRTQTAKADFGDRSWNSSRRDRFAP